MSRRAAAPDRRHEAVARVCADGVSLTPYPALPVKLAPLRRGVLFPRRRAFSSPERAVSPARNRPRGASRWLVDRRRRLLGRRLGRLVRRRNRRYPGNRLRRRFRRRFGYLGLEHDSALIARNRPAGAVEISLLRVPPRRLHPFGEPPGPLASSPGRRPQGWRRRWDRAGPYDASRRLAPSRR